VVIPDESKAVCSLHLHSAKRKPPCRVAHFGCGDGGNRTRVQKFF